MSDDDFEVPMTPELQAAFDEYDAKMVAHKRGGGQCPSTRAIVRELTRAMDSCQGPIHVWERVHGRAKPYQGQPCRCGARLHPIAQVPGQSPGQTQATKEG
jgi:hypothetical protein